MSAGGCENVNDLRYIFMYGGFIQGNYNVSVIFITEIHFSFQGKFFNRIQLITGINFNGIKELVVYNFESQFAYTAGKRHSTEMNFTCDCLQAFRAMINGIH